MKKILSRILSFSITAVMLSSFALCANAAEIQSPTATGDFAAEIIAGDLPAPTYTVTIPEKVDFADIHRVHEKKSEAEKIAKTALLPISINHSKLYESEKKLTVSLNAAELKMNDESNHELLYKLYREDNSEITGLVNILTADPQLQDINADISANFYATLDQSQIRVGGKYTGILTFTVTLDDIA